MATLIQPRLVLGVICAVILVVACFASGHSVESMDVRTYAQMIRGVAEHGLPYWDNGPIDRFPGLVVPWGTPSRGHVWGIYGPLYAYIAAPSFILGGLEGVSRFTFALLAPLALVTFLLARRLVASEWYATLAGLLSVVSTPLVGKALEVTAFPLLAVLATLAGAAGVAAIDAPPDSGRAQTNAFVAGVAWAAATATHALASPMAVVGVAVLAFASVPGARPSRTAFLRLAPATAGLALGLAPLAYLNSVRFASWNPVSYGPMPWAGAVNPALQRMTLAAQVRDSAPAALFLGVVLAGLMLARGRRSAVAGVLVTALVLGLGVPALRARIVPPAVAAWGFLVDLSTVPIGEPYQRPADGLGWIFGGWLAKSTLQCTPLLLLAPLSLGAAGSRRWPLVVTLAPPAALYLSLLARSSFPYPDVFGFPWTYIRYTVPALPALLAASAVVVESLSLRRSDLLVGSGVATVLLVAFGISRNDDAFAKRFALLVVPPTAAMIASLAVLRAPKVARTAVGVVLGLGVAVGLGHDLRANYEAKVECDRVVEAFVATVPRRFAIAGWLGSGYDTLLTTTATHDVAYADFFQLGRYDEIRPLFDYWRDQGRPIFVFWHELPASPWPDVVFTGVVGIRGVFLVEWR